MIVGFVMNWIGIVFMVIYINTYGQVIFDMSGFPDWAAAAVGKNATTVAAAVLNGTLPAAAATTALPAALTAAVNETLFF